MPNDAPSEHKHPPVRSLEEVITFRLQRLVTIGDRAGNSWSERLYDLSLNEWRLLALVAAHAPARAGDMSDLLYMDKSQISRLIRALQDKELIQNSTDPNDRRAIALRPTQKGMRLHAKMMHEVMQSNERVLSPLSAEEVLRLHEMLDRLIGHTDALLQTRLAAES